MTRTDLQPVLFVGHGSPEHGLHDTVYSRAFTALGAAVPRPEAILVISAHWQTSTRATTGEEWPETIHDFGGFEKELSEITYPAPGAPILAARVAQLVGGSPRVDWGFDWGSLSMTAVRFDARPVLGRAGVAEP